MERAERIGLTHMEQLIEFPVGTLICHASFPVGDVFKVTGWFADNLEVVRANPVGSDSKEPYYFAQIGDVTIVGEATYEF